MTIVSTITNVVLRIVQSTGNKNFAVYKDNKEVLEKVQFVDGKVEDDAKLMDHPLENGAIITDHLVFNPNKANFSVVIDDDDTTSLAEINEYYKNAVPLTLKAKGEMYPNMVIYSKPFNLSANYFNKTAYSLAFRTVQTADTQYVKMTQEQVKNPKNSSTSHSGQIKPSKTL